MTGTVKRPRRVSGRIFIALIAVFLYAPILVMVVFSFNDSKSRSVWAGFTTRWYEQLASNELVLSSLYTTLSVAVLASVISTVLGTFAAIGIHSMRRSQRSAMMQVNNIPVVNPDIISGVSFRLLFVVMLSALLAVNIDAELGYFTLLLAHISFCVPYIILSVMPKLSQMGKHVYEAALDLGAAPVTALWKVVLPEIMPGVVSGFMLAFTMSIDDFIISFFTSGTAVQTLPVTIFSMTRKGVSPEIYALSTLMFAAVLLLLVMINVFQTRDIKRTEAQKKGKKGFEI